MIPRISDVNFRQYYTTPDCKMFQTMITFTTPNFFVFLQAILAKMERALEIKLRGKDKGAPLAPKVPAAAAPPAAKGRAGHGK